MFTGIDWLGIGWDGMLTGMLLDMLLGMDWIGMLGMLLGILGMLLGILGMLLGMLLGMPGIGWEGILGKPGGGPPAIAPERKGGFKWGSMDVNLNSGRGSIPGRARGVIICGAIREREGRRV